MARGPKKHLKRLNTPKHWMLDKLTGVWAPRPSCGPHKLRECVPLVIILRNRLKYALTAKEAKMILMNRNVKVDGKVRTDNKYPIGFMDVIRIDATKEAFRMTYDVKGRFVLYKIQSEDQKNWKLCRVVKRSVGNKGIPYIVTHDGRTIRYPDPDIKQGFTIKYDFIEGKIEEFFEFKQGQVAMITGGHNMGRVGVINKIEKHAGSFDIIHLKDSRDHHFATRKTNVFIIGDEHKPIIGLPKTKGLKYSVIEERRMLMEKKAAAMHS